MSKTFKGSKRLLSLLLCAVLFVSCVPAGLFSVSAAVGTDGNRIVDPNTMDGWKSFFGPDRMTTENAGGVWMDKSVFTDTSAFPSDITMTDPDNDFLVALSAIASNKEITRYSTIPTDTVLVLNVSGSMEEEASSLVLATNQTIDSLLTTNQNNRVGVVLYSGNADFGASTYSQSAMTLLPIDRYTSKDTQRVNIGSNRNPEYVTVPRFLELNNGEVQINNTVENSKEVEMASNAREKAVEGGTYIQAGMYEALKSFQAVTDVTVGSDNIQDGQKRLPIIVLMSDGAPTSATSAYDNVGDANVGNGSEYSSTENVAFLNQLTASYVLRMVEQKYNRIGEGLFYTLGLGVGQNTVSQSILDPSNNTTDTINSNWTNYTGLQNTATMELTLPRTNAGSQNNRNPGTKTVAIAKNSNVANRHYVDQYFEADDATEMMDAFAAIVREIIIQSRYYPTHLNGGNPDLSGYITFEDKLGSYMEVKDIKGILLGDQLFSGQAMASKLDNNSDTGLGSVADPTALGREFINAVQTRLGIASLSEAIALVDLAYAHKQLFYDKDTGEFSNYIGWYAKADGTFDGFWQEGVTSPDSDAVYANKSYGFLGPATGSIQDSDMMYMSVQVHTHISTGEQTVIWKIPAALVPMVTYKVSLKGNTIEEATGVELTLEDETVSPIRLLFETGLRDTVNELSVAQITNPTYIADDGVTRQFWSNHWYAPPNTDHSTHTAALAGFIPSEENERYYYTNDAVIYRKDGNDYVKVTDKNTVIDPDGTYYHVRYVFVEGEDLPQPYYEQISAASLDKAEYDETYDNNTGAWIIPIGTVYQYFTAYQIPKAENATDSIVFSHFPFVTLTNSSYESNTKLGNNGLVKVTPATGIKLSKFIDIPVPGASTDFQFRITLKNAAGSALSGTYDTTLTPLDQTVGTKSTLTFDRDGVAQVDLKADQTLYITGLPAGATYTVEEVSTNEAYRVKSVHVNGQAVVGDTATGTVTTHALADVDFMNTSVTKGNLVLTKRVTHPFGPYYMVPWDLEFTAKVTLSNAKESVVNKTYELQTSTGTSSVTTNTQGQFTVIIGAEESISIRDIPIGTTYTVEEIDIPTGFAQDVSASRNLNGTISGTNNVQVVLVNEYNPEGVVPNVTLEVTKSFTGREWKANEAFTFTVQKYNLTTRAATDTVGTLTLSDTSPKTLKLDLSDINSPGEYYYSIAETPGESGKGITYDTRERRFYLEVTDVDMDGYLEIAGVHDLMLTTVTGSSEDGFKVSASFTNTYAPITGSTVTIPVSTQVMTDNFALNGFKFALYDETGTNKIHESTLTNPRGHASFTVAYAASDAGKTLTYKLKEEHTGIRNMTYDDAVYTVTVSVKDNGDGTTAATYAVTDENGDPVDIPVFENAYDSQDAQLVISGSKTLIGRVQNANEFEFNLYETDDSFDIEGKEPLQSVGNTYSGDFLFDILHFTEAKDYYYVVTEANGGTTVNGMTYSDQQYRITVRVVNDNGTLTVGNTTMPEEGIVFNNIYAPVSATVTLEGSKELTGRNMTDKEFTFVLKDEQGDVLQTKTNTDAAFVFDTITYDTVGTYRYTVTEEKGDLDGVSYDDAVYDVTVTVSDDSIGHLHANVAITKNGAASDLIFHNTYAPAPVTIALDGEKTLEGRAMKEGEFAFRLTNALSGQTMQTVPNAADGSFAFSEFPIRVAGNFHYTVTEDNTELSGINYDTSVYDLYLTIEDNGSGQLEITDKRLLKDGETTDAIAFANTYVGVEDPDPEPNPDPEPDPEPNPDPEPPVTPLVPQTGETSHLGLLFTLLFVSGTGVFAIAYAKKITDPKTEEE